MSTPVRHQDMEHFAIVRDSLARDGLHVAMAAHDRRRLQDYAGALARALAGQSGLRVEAYNPSRLESLVVDLMLHRFDAALSDISGHGASGGHDPRFNPVASRPGCVLFIPDAHALPRAEFRQLLRIAAGTRRNGLRLVALFDADSPACDERIADMGVQVARWDLDDDADADMARAAGLWRRGRDAHAAQSGSATPRSSSFPSSSMSSLPRMAGMPAMHLVTGTARSLARNGNRWLAAACAAAMLALLPAMLPSSGVGTMLSPAAERTAAHTLTNTISSTVTRSGLVELAGEPRQDFARARTSDDSRIAERDTLPDAAGMEGKELRDNAGVNAHGAPSASTAEAASR